MIYTSFGSSRSPYTDPAIKISSCAGTSGCTSSRHDLFSVLFVSQKGLEVCRERVCDTF